jgi:hypothetical protein
MGISKGYNYATGKWSLDCDKCGSLGASRIKCPIKYCVPVQLCATCAKETGWRKKDKHVKCAEYQAEAERERLQFLEESTDKWVSVASWGDWAEWVPSNMVGVCAYRGGNPAGRIGEESYWLVPSEEYSERHELGFVIDELRHYRFENNPTLLTTKEVSLS